MLPVVLKTYADVPNRERFLREPAVEILLDALPSEVGSLLVEDYCAVLPQHSATIRDYFTQNSAISKDIDARPGSALAFEYLYERRAPTEIDRYYLDCLAGRAIHARLATLTAELPQLLESLSSNGDALLIDNVGSGVGRDMIQVLDMHASLRRRAHVRNIDPDIDALNAGRQLAESKALAQCTSYEVAAMQEVSPNAAHLVLLIGILCPLPINAARQVLRNVHRLARPGGVIVFSTALHKMLEDDPVTDFLMRLHGWAMSFKTIAGSRALVDGTGWTYVGSFRDEPLGHHCMVVARRD